MLVLVYSESKVIYSLKYNSTTSKPDEAETQSEKYGRLVNLAVRV